MKLTLLLPVAALLFAACSKQEEPAASTPNASAAAAPTPAASSAVPPAAPPSAPLDGGATAQPSDDEAAGGAPPEEDEATADEEASHDVEVENVGMRIAGGANDAAAKEPIRKAIMAEFPRFRACHAKVTGKRRSGTYGVDLRIPREGGKAKIREPRSELKGEAFKTCMKEALERIEFPAPAGHKPTMVSYSVRFRAKKGSAAPPQPPGKPAAAEEEPEDE